MANVAGEEVDERLHQHLEPPLERKSIRRRCGELGDEPLSAGQISADGGVVGGRLARRGDDDGGFGAERARDDGEELFEGSFAHGRPVGSLPGAPRRQGDARPALVRAHAGFDPAEGWTIVPDACIASCTAND
jgi:hypothetical protein